MTDIESKLPADVVQTVDADPFAAARTRYLASIAMTALATVLAIAADSKVAIPNLSLVFVVPVIIAGVGLGLGPALCAAVVGALAFNFFLTEPRYSLAVDDPSNIWAIGLLFVVGLIASGVAFTSRRRAMEAERLRRQAAIVQRYTQDAAAAESIDAILSITARSLATLFRVPAVAMLVEDGKIVSIERAGDVEPVQAELEAARSSLAGSVVRGGIYPNETSRFDFWPARTAEGRGAVVGLAFDPEDRPPLPDVPVGTMAGILALVLGRRR